MKPAMNPQVYSRRAAEQEMAGNNGGNEGGTAPQSKPQSNTSICRQRHVRQQREIPQKEAQQTTGMEAHVVENRQAATQKRTRRRHGPARIRRCRQLLINGVAGTNAVLSRANRTDRHIKKQPGSSSRKRIYQFSKRLRNEVPRRMSSAIIGSAAHTPRPLEIPESTQKTLPEEPRPVLWGRREGSVNGGIMAADTNVCGKSYNLRV